MLYEPYMSAIQVLHKAWFRGEKRVRLTVAGSIILVGLAILIVAIVQPAGCYQAGYLVAAGG
jgi:hypothetical protein